MNSVGLSTLYLPDHIFPRSTLKCAISDPGGGSFSPRCCKSKKCRRTGGVAVKHCNPAAIKHVLPKLRSPHTPAGRTTTSESIYRKKDKNISCIIIGSLFRTLRYIHSPIGESSWESPASAKILLSAGVPGGRNGPCSMPVPESPIGSAPISVKSFNPGGGGRGIA